MIEETIYTTLTTDATVAGLVSTRVYPEPLPQAATFPAVTYQFLGGPRDASLAGASGTSRARFRFQCWADTHDEARSLVAAVRSAMDALNGALALVNPFHIFDDDDQTHRFWIDYYIHHQED